MGFHDMNQMPFSASEIEERLGDVCRKAQIFLRARQVEGTPFGHFNLCASAYAADELSGATTGIELWKMLRLPVDEKDLSAAHDYLSSLQMESGLLHDPAWGGRVLDAYPGLSGAGDSFFTRSAIAALKAWGLRLERPILYLREQPIEAILAQIKFDRGGHDPYSIGDLAVLIDHNAALGVAGAEALQDGFLQIIRARQDMASGLWVEPMEERSRIHAEDGPWTPHINRTFHTIKFTYNEQNAPLPHADRMIDYCLRAKDDADYYSWETGYACNELDLPLVLYSASRWVEHRREEIAQWARERLPMILSNQKPDGGFSFSHEAAQDRHFMLEISPGNREGDLWGTVMYLGAIKMMTHLGYPGVDVPWDFSRVHAVPKGSCCPSRLLKLSAMGYTDSRNSHFNE